MSDEDEIELIENAWVKNHATGLPRNASADIATLLRVIRAERTACAEAKQSLAGSVHVLGHKLAVQQTRATEFERIALKASNALVEAQSQIVNFEDLVASISVLLDEAMRLGGHYQWSDDDADQLRILLRNGKSVA